MGLTGKQHTEMPYQMNIQRLSTVSGFLFFLFFSIFIGFMGLTGKQHTEMPYQMNIQRLSTMSGLLFYLFSFPINQHNHCIFIVINFIKTFDSVYKL